MYWWCLWRVLPESHMYSDSSQLVEHKTVLEPFSDPSWLLELSCITLNFTACQYVKGYHLKTIRNNKRSFEETCFFWQYMCEGEPKKIKKNKKCKKMWYETLNMVDFLWLQIRWELKICCCCSAFKHDWNHVYRLSKEAVNFLASTADVNNAMQTQICGQ